MRSVRDIIRGIMGRLIRSSGLHFRGRIGLLGAICECFSAFVGFGKWWLIVGVVTHSGLPIHGPPTNQSELYDEVGYEYPDYKTTDFLPGGPWC